jgi:hypothetical protein
MAPIFPKYGTKKHGNMALILRKYGIYLFKTGQNKQLFKNQRQLLYIFQWNVKQKLKFQTFFAILTSDLDF